MKIEEDKITYKTALRMRREAYTIKGMIDSFKESGDLGRDGYKLALLLNELIISTTEILVNSTNQMEQKENKCVDHH